MVEPNKKTSKNLGKSEGLTELSCRSAVCGGDPFIPDSEYQGGNCELTCDVEKKD